MNFSKKDKPITRTEYLKSKHLDEMEYYSQIKNTPQFNSIPKRIPWEMFEGRGFYYSYNNHIPFQSLHIDSIEVDSYVICPECGKKLNVLFKNNRFGPSGIKPMCVEAYCDCGVTMCYTPLISELLHMRDYLSETVYCDEDYLRFWYYDNGGKEKLLATADDHHQITMEEFAEWLIKNKKVKID